MNILEHYVKEIHSIECVEMPFETDEKWVKVNFTVDCYGRINRTELVITISEWHEICENGYYMA